MNSGDQDEVGRTVDSEKWRSGWGGKDSRERTMEIRMRWGGQLRVKNGDQIEVGRTVGVKSGDQDEVGRTEIETGRSG